MEICHIKFRGFGRWVDKEVYFKPGINLIEAPNEAGKSTLIQGVFALLYGPKKEGVKKQVKADWYGRYLPWTGNDYGGEIEYTLDNHSYRLIRTLFLPHDKSQLINSLTGREMNDQFSMDSKKDRMFLEEQVGVSGEILKHMCFLSSHSLSQKDGTEDRVIEKMKEALYGQGVDVQSALKYLEKKAGEIGNRKQESKKMGHAFSKCIRLEEEVLRLREDYRILVTDIKKCSELNKRVISLEKQKKVLEEERERAHLLVLKNKSEEIENRIHLLEDEHKQFSEFKEEDAYQKIALLEEFIKLEEQNEALTMTGENSLREYRLQGDIADVIKLQEEEKELEEKRIKVKETLENKGAFSFLNSWVIGSVVSVIAAILCGFWIPFTAFIPLGICFFCLNKVKNISVPKGDTGHLVLLKEMEQLDKEIKQIQSLQEEIFKQWSSHSLAALYSALNRMRQKERMCEEGVFLLSQNEEKMELIHQDVKKWMACFVNRVPLFHPEQWIEEIRRIIHQEKGFREAVNKLQAMKASNDREAIFFHNNQVHSSKDVKDIQNEYCTIEEELNRVKEEKARLEGKIESVSESVEGLPLKEREWEETKNELADLEKERNAYELAKETIMEVDLKMQDTMGPQLIPVASKWLNRISGERYEELLISVSNGIHLNVLVPETGESQSIGALSKGTVDQVILCLRISMLQFYVDHTNKPLPLFLDDYFVHFDTRRLQSTLRLLGELASIGHQIVLCTCSERERYEMDRMGINYHMIDFGGDTPAKGCSND